MRPVGLIQTGPGAPAGKAPPARRHGDGEVTGHSRITVALDSPRGGRRSANRPGRSAGCTPVASSARAVASAWSQANFAGPLGRDRPNRRAVAVAACVGPLIMTGHPHCALADTSAPAAGRHCTARTVPHPSARRAMRAVIVNGYEQMPVLGELPAARPRLAQVLTRVRIPAANPIDREFGRGDRRILIPRRNGTGCGGGTADHRSWSRAPGTASAPWQPGSRPGRARE
jgi:hypothetical protein